MSDKDRAVGFLAFIEKDDFMYLSKLYLYKSERGKGYAKDMVSFVIENAKEAKLPAVELNVNRHNSAVSVYGKLGFTMVRTEKNDIGSGYYMDDFVYRMEV